jgi:hypothetical protein
MVVHAVMCNRKRRRIHKGSGDGGPSVTRLPQFILPL